MNAKTPLALFVVLVLGIAAGTGIGWTLKTRNASDPPASAPAAVKAERRILYYRNPMDPNVRSDKPVKDSMGMDYIPVYGDDPQPAGSGVITLDTRVAQNLGVRVGSVARRTFSREIHTVSTVAVDEHGVSVLNPRVSGWVERLYVRAVGDAVRRGQVLAEIYSPELASALEEYRVALQGVKRPAPGDDPRARADGRALLEAARERLRRLNVPQAEIRAVERGAPLRRTVPLRAPFNGVVTELGARQGGYVTPETRIYSLADLSKVWVNVEIYASQLPWVQPGAPVSLTLPFMAGREWRGRIDYLYPTLDTQSRTVKARLVFDNPDGVLRPGMYANAHIRSTPRESLVVPREAVIRTGTRDVVILALGRGRFKPVAVRLGAENGQDVEILDGLEEGQRIALSGQFLLDAEANFQAAAQRLDGADAGAPAAPAGTGNPAAAGAHGGH